MNRAYLDQGQIRAVPGGKDEHSMGAVPVEVVAESLSDLIPGRGGHSVDACLRQWSE